MYLKNDSLIMDMMDRFLFPFSHSKFSWDMDNSFNFFETHLSDEKK